MKELIAEEENVIDITAMEEDNIVLLNVEHQLGCTPEIYDILVEFFNMGTNNSLNNANHLYVPDNIVEEDIMELFYEIGFAHKTKNNEYLPTMLWGIHGRNLCQAVAQVIEVNQSLQ